MPWALLAITAMQIGFQMHQQNQAQAAANASNIDSARNASQNQSNLTEDLQRERRRGQGTVLGGNNTPASADISRQGTILGQSNQQNRSLLGG